MSELVSLLSFLSDILPILIVFIALPYGISCLFDSFLGKLVSYYLTWTIITVIVSLLVYTAAGAGMAVADGGASVSLVDVVVPVAYAQLGIVPFSLLGAYVGTKPSRG